MSAGLQLVDWSFGAMNGSVERLTCQVPPGSHCVIVGASGSGKTRAALELLGLLSDPVLQVHLDGALVRDGARRFAFVPSDPYLMLSLIGATLSEELGLAFTFIGEPINVSALHNVTQNLRLTALMNRQPWNLSGGEAMRAAIAMALLKSPRVLVLDDVWESLDADAKIFVESVLSDWRKQTSGIILEMRRVPPPSHQLGIVLFLVHQHDRTAHSCGADSQVTLSRITEGTCAIDRLTCSYPNNQQFRLGPVTAAIPSGEAIALTGPNGAGKTSCLKAIAGVVQPDGGTVTVRGQEIARSTPLHKRASFTQYVFQNPDDQLSLATVRDELAATAKYLKSDRGDVATVAECLGLADILEAAPLELPRSIRRLITIGAAFVANSPLVLLDEPTIGLDDLQAQRVSSLLRAHCSRGGSVLFVSHNPDFVDGCADRIWRLENGQLT